MKFGAADPQPFSLKRGLRIRCIDVREIDHEVRSEAPDVEARVLRLPRQFVEGLLAHDQERKRIEIGSGRRLELKKLRRKLPDVRQRLVR